MAGLGTAPVVHGTETARGSGDESLKDSSQGEHNQEINTAPHVTKDVELAEVGDKSASDGSSRPTCPILKTVLYGACLSCCDGCINANTKMRFNTYGGMMTGNTVSLGMSFAREEWTDAALFATIIFCFFFGAVVGWAASKHKKHGSLRYLVVFVSIGFVTLEALVQAVDSKDDQRWVSAISPFLMGMVDVIGFKGSLGQHVTFMTGNVQKLAGTTWDLLSLSRHLDGDNESKPNTAKREQKALTKLQLDLCTVGTIWTSYVLGAIAGACMSKVGDDGAWTLCVPAGIIACVVILNEGPDSSTPAPKKEPPLFRLFGVGAKDGISISDLRTLYDKLGLTLSPEEESRFRSADSNDDGILDRDELRAWMAA